MIPWEPTGHPSGEAAPNSSRHLLETCRPLRQENRLAKYRSSPIPPQLQVESFNLIPSCEAGHLLMTPLPLLTPIFNKSLRPPNPQTSLPTLIPLCQPPTPAGIPSIQANCRSLLLPSVSQLQSPNLIPSSVSDGLLWPPFLPHLQWITQICLTCCFTPVSSSSRHSLRIHTLL